MKENQSDDRVAVPDTMPEQNLLMENQAWGFGLLDMFFEGLRRDQLPVVLNSPYVERFLQHTPGGAFGGQLPIGTPGSQLPGVGVRNALDILRHIFRGMSFGADNAEPGSELAGARHGSPLAALQDIFNQPGGALDMIDRPGSVQLSSFTEPNQPITRFVTHNPETGVTTLTEKNAETNTLTITQTFRDKHVETYTEVGGASPSVTRTNSADDSKITLRPDGRDGMIDGVMIIERSDRHSHTVTRTKADGTKMNDDEGLDSNTGLGPLDHIHPGQPQSLQQMVNQMEHPGSDSEELDPNNPNTGVTFTEEDRARLGLTAPVAEVLDPNSGLDPLAAQFTFDPSQMRGRTEDDDRIDPNTGLVPTPGG